ncbi:SDR family oxidoreductase [Micromonospora pisi]|uniref:SDR family oxidoreductase n=1 Tax=Micromonospora pisi TaxID=589240 RepID=UPI001FE3112D|nr:SDR family oxidoreductase [Micromonospora pisi]
MVGRAGPAQGAEQVERGRVDVETGQGTSSLVIEDLTDAPDPGDDADRLDRCAGAFPGPGARDAVYARQGAGAYGAAKAAVEAWTASLAGELGPRGITANVVAPGLIVDTEFFRDRMTPEGVDRRVAATRNGRAGTADDVAATIAFLASPAAGHLTGQVIHVNGGAYLGR